MTNDEAAEKYGNTKLKFSKYYKYSFEYFGEAEDGAKIHTSFGGSSDDIYRHEVEADYLEKLGNPEGNWMYVSIKKDGEKIYEYSDY